MTTATKTRAKAQPAALTLDQIVELVDKIGTLKAKLAPEIETLEKMVGQLKANGVDRYLGDAYEANVFDSERTKYDMDAIRAKLSPQFLAAHSEPYNVRTCKVTARKTASN